VSTKSHFQEYPRAFVVRTNEQAIEGGGGFQLYRTEIRAPQVANWRSLFRLRDTTDSKRKCPEKEFACCFD
jgi:hypothetical protein